MPPVATDGRGPGDPTRYGNVSVFTPVAERAAALTGVLPRPAPARCRSRSTRSWA